MQSHYQGGITVYLECFWQKTRSLPCVKERNSAGTSGSFAIGLTTWEHREHHLSQPA